MSASREQTQIVEEAIAEDKPRFADGAARSDAPGDGLRLRRRRRLPAPNAEALQRQWRSSVEIGRYTLSFEPDAGAPTT
jgi:hypothetical protein